MHKKNRSSESGQYVTQEFAEANKSTTVAEVDKLQPKILEVKEMLQESQRALREIQAQLRFMHGCSDDGQDVEKLLQLIKNLQREELIEQTRVATLTFIVDFLQKKED